MRESWRFLEVEWEPWPLRLGSRCKADCALSVAVPAGPASQKMHYYRYSNAEVSCWYKYLLFSYNIVFWVSPGAPPWSLGRNLHHRVLILPVLLMTRLQGGLGKMWAGSMVPVLLEPARSIVMGAPR